MLCFVDILCESSSKDLVMHIMPWASSCIDKETCDLIVITSVWLYLCFWAPFKRDLLLCMIITPIRFYMALLFCFRWLFFWRSREPLVVWWFFVSLPALRVTVDSVFARSLSLDDFNPCLLNLPKTNGARIIRRASAIEGAHIMRKWQCSLMIFFPQAIAYSRDPKTHTWVRLAGKAAGTRINYKESS